MPVSPCAQARRAKDMQARKPHGLVKGVLDIRKTCTGSKSVWSCKLSPEGTLTQLTSTENSHMGQDGIWRVEVGLLVCGEHDGLVTSMITCPLGPATALATFSRPPGDLRRAGKLVPGGTLS